jgi:starch synthase
LYNDEFKHPLKDNFAKKLKIEGVTQNDIKGIKEKADFNTLSKLAIDFSDGIIAGSADVDQNLIEYAKQKEGSFFLPFQPEGTYIEAFDTFYNEILS